MMVFRFLQGVGTGGEVPVASAYINESHRRAQTRTLLPAVRSHLPYRPDVCASAIFVPVYGWKAMFVVGLVPSVLTLPPLFHAGLPRWLAAKDASSKPTPLSRCLKKKPSRKASLARAGDPSDRSQVDRQPIGANCSRVSI